MQHAPALQKSGLQKAGPQKTGDVTTAKKFKDKNLSKKKISQLENLFNTGQFAALEQQARQMLDDHPQEPFVWACLGVALRTLGQTQHAIHALQQAVALKPKDAEYRNNLAAALNDVGLSAEAEANCRRAIAIKPRFAGAHNNLGIALSDQGRGQEAEASYRQAVAITPRDASIHNNLGDLLRTLTKYPEAEEHLRRAIALKPDYADAHNNLGILFKELGRLADAEACYRRAVAINGAFVEGYSNLGSLLLDAGQLAEALAFFRKSLELNPNHRQALINLGRTLLQLKQISEAEHCLQRALDIAPDAALYNELGLVLLERKDFVRAEENFRRATELKSDVFEYRNNLGVALLNLRKYADAEGQLRKALALNPGIPRICGNLGTALYSQGNLVEAETFYLKATVDPNLILKYSIAARLLLPAIPQSLTDVIHWREHFAAGVEALRSLPVFNASPDPGIGGFFFQLAYHNADNKSQLEALAQVLREKLPALNYTAPHIATWRRPAPDHRVRIGFLSEFLVAHTIAKLFQGIIQKLDRTRFEVVIIHTPDAKHDAVSAFIDSLGAEVIKLPTDLRAQQETVANAKLDILFYPDIGMTPSTYFLAYARLAPIQVVSWGHPDTTGLHSIDYFVSTSLIETENADEYYTERLVQLRHLPCFYLPIAAATETSERAELGLPLHGTLYGCPQSLFKLHPDFDAVLAEIAAGDPSGHIVLLEGSHKHLTPLLRARWKNTFPLLLERVCILPEQPQQRFMALMAAFDVLLDPIYFGSGNTLYEALVYGTPIVTFPAPFMRGRIVAGAYKQMRVDAAPVAQRIADYAPLALALGKDAARRTALRETLREAGKTLFEDHQVIREFETFFDAALATATRGERLPGGWQPDDIEVRT
jgi:predicted O-linked N-acetylglucosamine transferase (SPINDLY family)